MTGRVNARVLARAHVSIQVHAEAGIPGAAAGLPSAGDGPGLGPAGGIEAGLQYAKAFSMSPMAYVHRVKGEVKPTPV